MRQPQIRFGLLQQRNINNYLKDCECRTSLITALLSIVSPESESSEASGCTCVKGQDPEFILHITHVINYHHDYHH